MNQSHALAGVGGVSTTAMLATVLQTFQHVDTATATSEAGLLVLGLGALAGIAQALLPKRAQTTIIPSVWLPPVVQTAPGAPLSAQPAASAPEPRP